LGGSKFVSEEISLPLAELVRQHDATALGAYLEQRRMVFLSFIEHRMGSTLRGKFEPQDILQELAIKALRELPQTDLSARDPFSWLCHLAEQCIVDGHRRFAAGKRDAGREVSGNVPAGEGSQDMIVLLEASMTTPTQAVVRDERQRRLDEAIATFPEEHREILRLRYGEGLSTKEVAQRIGKSDGATRVLLTRLVQRLQYLLGAEEAP
jgi:RNA polymerase sigma-70 factor, ECF subfamily